MENKSLCSWIWMNKNSTPDLFSTCLSYLIFFIFFWGGWWGHVFPFQTIRWFFGLATRSQDRTSRPNRKHHFLNLETDVLKEMDLWEKWKIHQIPKARKKPKEAKELIANQWTQGSSEYITSLFLWFLLPKISWWHQTYSLQTWDVWLAPCEDSIFLSTASKGFFATLILNKRICRNHSTKPGLLVAWHKVHSSWGFYGNIWDSVNVLRQWPTFWIIAAISKCSEM